jgi:hypothetical protein
MDDPRLRDLGPAWDEASRSSPFSSFLKDNSRHDAKEGNEELLSNTASNTAFTAKTPSSPSKASWERHFRFRRNPQYTQHELKPVGFLGLRLIVGTGISCHPERSRRDQIRRALRRTT